MQYERMYRVGRQPFILGSSGKNSFLGFCQESMCYIFVSRCVHITLLFDWIFVGVCGTSRGSQTIFKTPRIKLYSQVIFKCCSSLLLLKWNCVLSRPSIYCQLNIRINILYFKLLTHLYSLQVFNISCRLVFHMLITSYHML